MTGATIRSARWLLAGAALVCACSSQRENSTGPTPQVTINDEEPPADDGDAPDEAEQPKPDLPAPEPAKPSWEPRAEDRITPHQALEFPERLGSFYDALAAVDDGEQKLVRVVHMGASMIGADDLPGVLRERFQTRFGDGGAGMVLLSRYMPNYLHKWVKIRASGWDHCYIAYKCMKDGHYGIGGTTFWSKGGAETRITTRKDELGDEVSRFEVWYLARPGGGRLDVKVDNGERQTINTRADVLEDRYHEIDVEQGPHDIHIRAAGYGNTRAYGVVLETDGPGLVWDQFSKLGVFTKKVLAWDKDHLAGQIAHRDPDLIVFTYGGNDLRRVANGKLNKEKYIEEYTKVVQHVRHGKPEAACLITSITDRGKSLTFDITPEHVETIVTGQRAVADKVGCAFFDTWTAMGGGGSLKKWKYLNPPLAAKDLKHLNHRGRVKLGGWIYDAIMAGYVAHRTETPYPDSVREPDPS